MLLFISLFFTQIGTSLAKGHEVGKIAFFDKTTLEPIQRVSISDESVISLLWHPKLNQIMCGSTDHKIHVLYNPEISTKGMTHFYFFFQIY